MPTGDFILRKMAERQLQVPVYKKLVKGSKPLVPIADKSQKLIIPRPELEQDLGKMFLTKPADGFNRFGVIIGLSGCGKTHAVREVCNRLHKGVLYYEVDVADTFTKKLGQEIGMKLSATGFFDVLLGYISNSYRHHHSLPNDQVAAIGKVFEILEESAGVYAKKYQQIPVLFIDGVDILAKHTPKLCEVLITLAKIMANNNKLKVVLVSSEGTIMPHLKRLSAANRASVYEVNDVTDEEATAYLIKREVPKDKAENVVKCVGGRLVYLQSCLDLFKSDDVLKGDELCEGITRALFSRVLSGQKSLIMKRMPESQIILSELISHKHASPSELICKTTDKIKMDEVIQEMVEENIIRYDAEGNVKWFGKIQEEELSKMKISEEYEKRDDGNKGHENGYKGCEMKKQRMQRNEEEDENIN